MWKRCLAFHILLQGIQQGLSLAAHYSRKSEQGHFSLHIVTISKPSDIQCASACSLTDGCSMISFSQKENLCELSAGFGVYVKDSDWTTLILREREQQLDNHVRVSAVTSPTNELSSMASSSSENPPMTSSTTKLSSVTSFTSEIYPMTSITTEISSATSSNTEISSETSNLSEESQTTSHPTGSTDTPMLETVASTLGTIVSTEVDLDGLHMVNPDAGGIACPSGFSRTTSGYCFKVETELRNFKAAHHACGNIGGYLAEMSGKLENMELTNLLQQRQTDLSKDVFIGGTDQEVEGTWTWLSGAPFLGWIHSAPSNFDSQADCLAYSYANAWRWSDVICTETYHYVCEADQI